MSLNEQINNDLKKAMKEKDGFTLGVIRMLKGAIQLAKTNVHDDISDEKVIDVIAREIKTRKSAIIEFNKAGRSDLVEQNEKEIIILEKYLPASLSMDEILQIIDEAFLKINPKSSKEMGLIMKEVNPKLKGRADMGEVSAIIKERLANL